MLEFIDIYIVSLLSLAENVAAKKQLKRKWQTVVLPTSSDPCLFRCGSKEAVEPDVKECFLHCMWQLGFHMMPLIYTVNVKRCNLHNSLLIMDHMSLHLHQVRSLERIALSKLAVQLQCHIVLQRLALSCV